MSLKISPWTLGTIAVALIVIAVLLYNGIDLWDAIFGTGATAAAYETGMAKLGQREKKIDFKIAKNIAAGEAKKEELKNANRKDGAGFFNNLFKRNGKKPDGDN